MTDHLKNESASGEKIFCPKCSKSFLDPDVNFCPYCGTRLSQIQGLEAVKPPPSDEKTFSRLDSDNKKEAPPPAGFWIRLGAFWMDDLIILLLAMFLGSLAYSNVIGQQLFPSLEKINLFIILLFTLYHALFLGRSGATPGKRFFGLAVVPYGGSSRFGYSEAFLRSFGYFISGIGLGIGFLWIAFDQNKQGWHDKIANTSVIRKARVPLVRRLVNLTLLTLLVFMMIALQFNLTVVYRSMFNPGSRSSKGPGREIVSVLVTQKEIKNGIFKEIETRAGPHTIKLPSSAHDGEIFKVNRPAEEGGTFYIRIVIVERI